MPARQGARTVQLPEFLTAKFLGIAAAVVVVIIVIVLVVSHYSNKSAGGQKQINDTVAKVSKLFLVPQGEQPTLAIINDASKYKNITFFKDAANGDRLLIYAQAREAILYRPSINKIIAVAPLNPGTAPTTTNTR